MRNQRALSAHAPEKHGPKEPLSPGLHAVKESDGTAFPDTDTEEPPLPAADARESAGDWIRGIGLIMVISGVTLVTFLMLLDISIVATAIPRITSDFHSLDDVGWYGSAYTIASASFQTLTGKFYTYFKSKWTFLSFFAIFEVGSLVCGLATSSRMLIVGRAVAGIGSSGMINGGLNIIAGAVPMHRRPVMIGLIMGISQLGLVSGPLLGGVFTTFLTWRWCFYTNLPIGGLVALLLVFARVPEQQPKVHLHELWRSLSPIHNFDLIGFVFFASTSIQLLLALEYGGNQYAWDSATVIGLFCGSGTTFLLLVIWERRMGPEAMIPARLVGRRIVWCSCLSAVVFYGVTLTMSYYLPTYFQAVRGKSALVSGVDLLPSILCQLVMAVISGVLTSRLGYYLPWGILGTILNGVGNGLMSTLTPSTPVRDWAGYQSLLGFGRGAVLQVPLIAIQNAVTPSEMSAAMAIMSFSQTLGGAVFLAVAQAIFIQALPANLSRYAAAVDAETVIAAGATDFREVVYAQDLPGVLVAYSKSIDRVFYMNIALCVVHFFLSWGVGWKDVRKTTN